MLAPLAASPAALALLVSSPAARYARCLSCRSLRSPLAAGRSACSSLRSHLLVLLTASLALALARLACSCICFLHRARAPDPVRLAESRSGPLCAPIYLGSRDPPGELPEGEDCVFRRPPVVIILPCV
jgi:hypothetical protein